jgi:hypothetical protein
LEWGETSKESSAALGSFRYSVISRFKEVAVKVFVFFGRSSELFKKQRNFEKAAVLRRTVVPGIFTEIPTMNW